MRIKMIGIDHNQASLDVRAKFSLTQKHSIQALDQLKNLPAVVGCVLLSTCNRMEIWIQEEIQEADAPVDLYGFLCDFKQLPKEGFKQYFREREDEEAIYHLFSLTCGLKSQILGEDQIITQVGEALSLAREQGCTNSILEVLFRKAVTAAKKVKSQVIFPKGSNSVMHKAIHSLQKQGYDFRGKCCMVIGNGQMGRAAAMGLLEAEAKVYVTVRQYAHGKVEVPVGAIPIDYTKRQEFLRDCEVIVSATTSPHYTLTRAMVVQALQKREKGRPWRFLDLAVPRDIDIEVGHLPGVQLYDIDDFKVKEQEEALAHALAQARSIVEEAVEEFYQWLGGHEVFPRLQYVKEEVVKDLSNRLTKALQELELGEEGKHKLSNQIQQAADKALEKLLFGVKDSLEKQEFLTCLEGLEELYEE